MSPCLLVALLAGGLTRLFPTFDSTVCPFDGMVGALAYLSCARSCFCTSERLWLSNSKSFNVFISFLIWFLERFLNSRKSIHREEFRRGPQLQLGSAQMVCYLFWREGRKKEAEKLERYPKLGRLKT